MQVLAESVLPSLPDTPSAGRQIVRDGCAACGLSALAATAELLVSELLTNAVVHAGGDVLLRLELTAAALFVSVADRDPRSPVVRPPSDERLGGRGLAIVAALADDWGVQSAPVGKAVWCRIALRRGPPTRDAGVTPSGR